ncbi:MAG TPA: bifunctional diaminohydroxyphosphoribosylaminopyrimidine deaminase/5-amino-6-(5-phosphoribosylamino)uracil reductase RibD, partial [Thermoanaerobaculia bacterium]
LFITLEPCSHHGRTPPCADAVIAAGIVRVVACHGDPNPKVAGRGFARLRAAGIEVESGFLVEEAVRLNLPFLIANVLGRPEVTLKWAMSLDGRIATATGQSQWISSPQARQWALALREEHDAILVGSGTLLADDPRLDRRLGLAAGPNLRVVLDRRLRTPPEARLLTIEGPVVIYTESKDTERIEALRARGAVLADLYGRGVQSLLVEGGGEVLASFVMSGCYDRVMVDCAPLLIGGKGAPGPLAGEGFAELAAAARLEGFETGRQGGDVILTAYRKGCVEGLAAVVQASVLAHPTK